ncbi:TPA: hypothetical protein ACIBVV_005080, partial [Salmonella enterica subsp. enterica serovar Potsdam]
ERAQEIFLGNGPEPTASEQRELARIALASLTAKPIAHTSQYGIDRMIRDNAGLLVQAHGGNAYEIPLYTTPPAPVVPEECPAELPYAQVKAVADLFALCWQSGEVVTYTPDPEKATIWLNNYSGTCVQEYVKLERLQEALAGNSPVIPEDLRRAFEAVARLNNEMYRWTSRMFYNGSYVGEPEGLLKRNIREIEHIMDSCRAAMLQDNQRDLSQPVDPQVAEYEQIMLQAGWVMVPVEPTEEMIAAAMECEDVLFNSDGSFCVQFREIYCAMVDAALALNKGEY